jgi:hypothetical protein
MAVIEDVYDVLRELAAGAARTGAIGEDTRTAINAVLNEADPKVAEAEAQAAQQPLTDAEAEQRRQLNARAEAAEAAAQAPPPVPTPGGGFNQAPAGGA